MMEQNIYEKRIEDLKEIVSVQCCKCDDYDPYARGVADGLIRALNVITHSKELTTEKGIQVGDKVKVIAYVDNFGLIGTVVGIEPKSPNNQDILCSFNGQCDTKMCTYAATELEVLK
ncbi:MAG: hypothetical protein GY861_22195 [bacterium]|nr:hypothetical protein [bacterium]